MQGKKDIARLIPTKKHIVRPTKTGDISDAEVTYYKKPIESKSSKEHKPEEKTITPKTGKKVAEVIEPTKMKEVQELLPKKIEKETPKIKLKAHDEIKQTKKMMEGIESFDDFKKIGVDPKAAELFFCRI